MISDGSCDTEDWFNYAENSITALSHTVRHLLHIYSYLLYITQYNTAYSLYSK